MVKAPHNQSGIWTLSEKEGSILFYLDRDEAEKIKECLEKMIEFQERRNQKTRTRRDKASLKRFIQQGSQTDAIVSQSIALVLAGMSAVTQSRRNVLSSTIAQSDCLCISASLDHSSLHDALKNCLNPYTTIAPVCWHSW